MTIRLPPLRDRMEDLPDIARGILDRLASARGTKAPGIDRSAIVALTAHSWPGNVRELENILTRAFVLNEGANISASDLEVAQTSARTPRHRTRREFELEERERILSALHTARWNVSLVSRTLGIPRNSLYRKLARFGLSRESGSWK